MSNTEQGRELDIRIGEWFGPSTISQVLNTLAKSSTESLIGFSINVATDGVVYQSTLEVPGLIMVPLLLGSGRQLNPVYRASIKRLFDIPQCVGLAGGRPNSSLYFIGYADAFRLANTLDTTAIICYTWTPIMCEMR